MGITGNLKTMALAELLQWLTQGQKTGTLVFDSGDIEKRVVFESGTIVSSASTDPAEYLGNFLVARGLVTDEQVDEALARQEKEGKLLGKILVEIEAVSEAELQEILQTKAEESIYDIFTWDAGDFRFLDGEVPEEMVVPIALDVQWIVLEGARRIDELGRLREYVPSPHAIAVSVVDLEELEVEDTEARILSWVDDQRTVEEISRDAQTTQLLVTQVLADQVQAGTVKIVKPRIIKVETPSKRKNQQDDSESSTPAMQQMVHPVYAQMPNYPPPQYMPMPTPSGQNLDALRNHPSFAGVGGGGGGMGGVSAPPQAAVAPVGVPGGHATFDGVGGESSIVSLPPEVSAIIEESERAVGAGELDAALAAIDRLKAQDAENPSVAAAILRAEKALGGALDRDGIALTSVPRLSCDMTSLTQLKISPSEGFMLTRVNGSYDIKSLLKMHPAPPLDVQLLFWKLKKSGHVAF